MQRSARKRQDPEARRRAIIDAAIVAIGERGYFGFTIQDLAKRCGLTNGGLLYHFKTKEELFLAVLVEYDRRAEETLRAIAAGIEGPAPLSKILELMRKMIDYSIAEPQLMRLFAVLQAEALHREHPGYEFFAFNQRRIVASLVKMIEPYAPDPEGTARQLYALMIGLEHQWLRADGAFDFAAEWDRAVLKVLPMAAKGDVS